MIARFIVSQVSHASLSALTGGLLGWDERDRWDTCLQRLKYDHLILLVEDILAAETTCPTAAEVLMKGPTKKVRDPLCAVVKAWTLRQWHSFVPEQLFIPPLAVRYISLNLVWK